MLPEKYKFHVLNKTGVQLDFNANSSNERAIASVRGWKYDSSNVLAYESTERDVLDTSNASPGPNSDIADDASGEAAEQTNTDDYLGLEGYFEVKTDNGSASGEVILFVEWSTDGGTTYPSDAGGFDIEQDLKVLAVVTLSGAETKATNFSF